MSIDWITVAAQLANFLVLVWLLKRFLYRPILAGIDAREAEIAERMQVAARAKEEAREAEANYRAQLAELRAEQASVTETVRREAEQERDTLLKEAHDRIEHERAAWQAHLDDEARSFTSRLHRAGGHALLELTRKALTDLGDDTLEARMAAHLARQIEPMREDMLHAAGQPGEAEVTSHVDLPETVRKDLVSELDALFPGIDVRFVTDTDQAPGLSLHLGGARLVWTVDSYIDALDEMLAEQLAAGADAKVRSR